MEEEGEGGGDNTAEDAQPAIPESEIQAITEEIDKNLDILSEDSGVGLFNLERILGDTTPGYEEAAREILEERGATITELENGSSLIVFENQGYSVSGGGGTTQVAGLVHNPIFQVHGAGHTSYLRTSVGDVYENGKWRQMHPVGFWVYPGEKVPAAVVREMENPDSDFARYPPERLDVALLAGFQTRPVATYTDVIRMTPIGSLEAFPKGPLPISLHLQSIDTGVFLWAYNARLYSAHSVPTYSWTSKIPVYSEAQLRQASVSSDATYTQLPSSIPDRVRQKAEEITRGYSSPYLKAKALERYLSGNFPYLFADSPDDFPPEGRDPVDWFLFDHQEGTCQVFSSAFAVMARSIGLPARVVTGWTIDAVPGTQTVYTDRAHQWAEVAFDGLGWVTFEPTAPGGPLSRARASGELVHSQGGPIRRETVIEIDKWPRETRKGLPFDIGGTVITLSGIPVNGIEVELFINETKEQGGWRLGTGTTENGRFEIEVRLPVSFEDGSYQLIAHAIGNDDYKGSWSDPEIGVYSGTEMEFSGPSEISVDEEGTYRGRLTEETGGSLGGRTLRVNIEGLAPFQVTTDDRGAFSFTRAFGRTGQRSVAVTFEQEGYMLGNEASLDVMVTMPSVLTIDAVDNVRVGEDFVINGTLRNIRGGVLAMQSIEVTLPDGEVASVQTRERGEFTVRGSMERRGVYGIQASFAGDDILEPSKSGYTLSVFEPVFLELSGDREVQVGGEYVINGTLMDSNGNSLALKQIEITLPGEVKASALTDEQGEFRMNAVAERPGRYGIEAAFSGEDVLEPSKAGYTLSVTEPVFLKLSGDREVQVGEEYVIRGSLADSRGAPISQREVDITLPEGAVTSVLTDQLGEFELKGVTDQPGRYAIEATFTGDDLLEPGRSGYTLSVVELVLLDLSGDRVVRVGAPYRLEGTLARTDGEGTGRAYPDGERRSGGGGGSGYQSPGVIPLGNDVRRDGGN